MISGAFSSWLTVITKVFTEIPFARYLLNSLLTSVAVTVLLLLFGSMAEPPRVRDRLRWQISAGRLGLGLTGRQIAPGVDGEVLGVGAVPVERRRPYTTSPTVS
ncbi:hypothetical protein [Amycolatopsis sp. ATCC 39116]|uniref:hypothetical protein n=1 Tax=Amycolatopsis sp. (strain ATCC 39116 / 75iv2) TaxID=385957 RepID=UPI000262559B|nr:hypothetical protein [Amycolatopsis sp. ATCC 39116]